LVGYWISLVGLVLVIKQVDYFSRE